MSKPTDGRPPGAPRIAPAAAGPSPMPPYTLPARLGDWWQARADGRAGLPSLEPGRPAGTPTLEEYAQDFLARGHRERLRLDVELAPLLESRASLSARIDEAGRAVGRAEARLAEMPVLLASDQLALRRGGETETADDVVAARRAREWEVMRRPTVDEAARLHSQITQLRVELARLDSAIRAREVVGATRVRRLHAQVMRRVSAYERHLVRRHPAGDRIGPVLAAQHPLLPGWVEQAESAGHPESAGHAESAGHNESAGHAESAAVPTPREAGPRE